MNAFSIVTSLPFWCIALLTICAVLVLAALIGQAALTYLKKEPVLTPQEIKSCLKAGGIAAVGPALSVFILAVSMISAVGGPVTLMRVGIIGSASTELVAASIGAQSAGTSLGQDSLSVQAMASALFTMALMSTGYLIFVPILARGLGSRLQKIFEPKENQKTSVGSILLGMVLPMALYVAMAISQAVTGLDSMLVLLFSIVSMVLFNQLSKKLNRRWLKEWSMGFAVLFSMLFGIILKAAGGGIFS